MEKNSKIYVAGHRGMVGSSLMRSLQLKGYNNIIAMSHSELDLSRQKEVENFFQKERPEYVFLAAAKVGGILANDTYKADFIYSNLMMAGNIVHSSYKYGVKKLLNLGSSCIYPKFAPQPLTEDSLLTGSLEPTNEPYAIAKISALKLCRYYNEQYGTDFISVMPTNLYGPHDNFNLETSHVLPALLRKFHLAKLLGDKEFELLKKDIQRIPLGYGINSETTVASKGSIIKTLEDIGITDEYVLIWGDGQVYREFLYVDDLANACIFLMEDYDHNEIGELINIGTGEDIKIKDLAILIKGIIGYKGDVKHDFSKPDGTPRKLLDISRIKKLGWKAGTTLEAGITKTYEWYCRAFVVK